jgi:guanylate kinase
VHGNRYGTSRKAIEQRMAAGGDVILEIDYQGAFNIKRLFSHAVLVFVLPPSLDELRRRITGRGEDPPERIELRMSNAVNEIAQLRGFDFVIINDSFEQALNELKALVQAQRLRLSPQLRSKPAVFEALGIH